MIYMKISMHAPFELALTQINILWLFSDGPSFALGMPSLQCAAAEKDTWDLSSAENILEFPLLKKIGINLYLLYNGNFRVWM